MRCNSPSLSNGAHILVSSNQNHSDRIVVPQARSFKSITFSIVDLARLVRDPKRFHRRSNFVQLDLPFLVRSHVEDLQLAIAEIKDRQLPLKRSSGNEIPTPASLSGRVRDEVEHLQKMRRRSRVDRLSMLQAKFPQTWLIRGVHDHPLVRIVSDCTGAIADIEIDEGRLTKLEREAEIISRVIEGSVLGAEVMSWTQLKGHLEELAPEIVRLFVKIKPGRDLPTGNLTVTPSSLLRVEIVNTAKMVQGAETEMRKLDREASV